MASTAGSVLLDVRANLERLKKDIEDALDKAGDEGGKKFASSFEKVQRKMASTGAALTKAVTLPVLGIGTAAVTAGLAVDEAFDSLRIKTGATGEQLDALKESFRTIASTSTQNLTAVADVVSLLVQRLKLSGPSLEQLSSQILNLQQIIGQPVDMDSLTRVFNAYRIAPDQYAATLDKIFRASQATGVGFNELTNAVVSQSAAFSELGFDLDETTALIGQFQKAGVNTETVLGALRQNIAKAAAAGQSAAEFFRSGVKEIQAYLAAGNDAAAQAKAKELFGAKTFLDALDAIRRGQFDISGTISQIREGGDTINQVASETADFPEQFQQFKNKLSLSLGELGQKLFPILTNAIEKLLPPIVAILDRFSKLDPKLQAIIIGAIALFAALGPIISIGSSLIGVISGVGAAMTFLAANPVVLLVAAIAVIIGLLAYLILNWEDTVQTLKMYGRWFADLGKSIAAPFIWAFNTIAGTLRGIVEFFKSVYQAIVEIIRAIGDAISGAFDAFTSLPGISSIADVFRADGGPVSAGKAYIVGEKGPELFVPSSSGRIVPNDQLSTTQSQTDTSAGLTINVYNPVAEPTSVSLAHAQRIASYRLGVM